MKMKKSLMILTVLLVMMVVGISGCITTMTDTQSNRDEVFTNLNTSLNTTGNFVKVNTITEYGAVVNKSRKNPKVDNNTASDILSKEKVKAAYEKLLSDNSVDFNVECVDGPYLYSNQTPYYVLMARESLLYYDDYSYKVMMEVDAKKLPGSTNEKRRIDTVFNTYYLMFESGEGYTPKISQQQILDKTKEVQQLNLNDYHISLTKQEDGKVFYSVSLFAGMNDFPEYMLFDADSGELVYHEYDGVVEHVGSSQEECRQLALDILDEYKFYTYIENLSLEDAGSSEGGNRHVYYHFNIVYTNPDGINETIGDIMIDSYNLSVTEYNINKDWVLNHQPINESDVYNLISEEEAINIVKSDVIEEVKEYPGPVFVSRMTFNSLGLGVSQVGTVYRVDTFIDGNFFMETDIDPRTGEIVDSVGVGDGSSGIREDGTWGPLTEEEYNKKHNITIKDTYSFREDETIENGT